jgi:hypothetical protein
MATCPPFVIAAMQLLDTRTGSLAAKTLLRLPSRIKGIGTGVERRNAFDT